MSTSRLGLAVSSVAFFLALGGLPRRGNADLFDGLISYWPFDRTLSDEGFLHQNDGQYVGPSPLTYADGKFGQAIDLDGAGGRNYVEVADDPSTQIEVENGGDGNISISAWFTVDSFTKDWQALIAKGEGTSWRVARRGSGDIMSYAGGVGEGPDGGASVNDGGSAWHHIVAITEHQVSTRLWVDGVLQTSANNPTITVNDPGDGMTNLHIGDNPDTGDRSWDGKIDDVALWNRVLTEDEIAALWSGGAGMPVVDPCGLGDANDDCVADILDFNIISNNFGKSPATRSEGNIAGGLDVDLLDFRLWKSNTGFGTQRVPEPAGIALSISGILYLLADCSNRIKRRLA